MNELQHHGVKGMKWGVRRNRKTSAPPVSSGRIMKKHRLRSKSGAHTDTDKLAKIARYVAVGSAFVASSAIMLKPVASLASIVKTEISLNMMLMTMTDEALGLDF